MATYLLKPVSRVLNRSTRAPVSGMLLGALLLVLAFGLPAATAHAAGVVGSGTPESCTEAALDAAILGGGSVTFNCGPGPVIVTLSSDLNLYSDVTIDGGGLVTLSGGGTTNVIVVKSGVNATVEHITIANGFSAGFAAGIDNNGTLLVLNSVFTNNAAATDGGAIASLGDLTVHNSTFSQNSALDGGAIANISAHELNVVNSTFSGNNAKVGGAFYNVSGGTLNLFNSTLYRNTAAVDGGGIYSDSTVSVINTTLSENTAQVDGASLYQVGGSFTVINSIVAHNSSANNCGGSMTDGGNNLDSDGSCSFSSGTTDPKLDTAGLQNNGGPTETIALRPTSPALGAGDTTNCQSDPVDNVDQTGQTRISGSDTTCDIGAFEGYVQPGAAFTVNTADPVLYGACRSIYCPLRDAVNAANSYNGNHGNPGATINLASGETYALTDVDNTTPQGANGLPVISSKITINGNGASIGRDGSVPTTFRIFQVKSGGTLNLHNATVSNGSAEVSGGGLLNNGGTVSINQATFSYNLANSGATHAPKLGPSGITPSGGGAIYNVGTMSIVESTFHLNSASYGGAIDNGGTLNVTNSTFTGNDAATLGGAVFNGAGSVAAINDTFSADRAKQGGELAVGGGKITIRNTIVANSAAGKNCYGSILNGGNNLQWPSADTTCVGKFGNPKLQPLADNGGPTQTMAVKAPSPAIGGASKPACLAAPVNNLDQRGVVRVIGADTKCDIGAYEAK